MSIFTSILAFGFLLGIRHATDADHVVAVSTITSRQKNIKGAAVIGMLWGIGHSITVTLVGLPIIFFSLKIPAKIEMALEFSVGVMLVILGLFNLYSFKAQIAKTITNIVHKHSHVHTDKNHSHLHIHIKSNADLRTHHLSLFQIIRPVFVGLVHGIAGSSAIAILILTTINNNLLATVYLIIFHIGVIVGMMIITTLLGTSIRFAGKKIAFVHKYLVAGSGFVSFILGAYIMYQVSFVDGLFTNKILK